MTSVPTTACPPGRRKPADGAQHGRLAGAGLADEPEGDSLRHVEAHVLDRIDPAAARAEDDLKVLTSSIGSRGHAVRPGRIAVQGRQRAHVVRSVGRQRISPCV